MKIYLPHYQEGVPVEVEHTYDAKTLDVEFVDLKYTGPILVRATVEKGPVVLVFRGSFKSGIKRICGRCLREVEEASDIPFELFYDLKGKVEIDTIDDLREQLLIDHPMVYVCRSDCRGLCPSCGADLNETECGCPKDES